MIVPYSPQPHGASPRPLIDVQVANSGFAVKALADSGAVNSLFESWVAVEAGVALDDGDIRDLGVGATTVQARFTTVALTAAGLTWEAEVGFTDDWPHGWGLVGHHALFRFFTVTFRAADLEFELEPIVR